MFTREIKKILLERLEQFSIVVLMGPRQSGKTTLLEYLEGYEYINLESPDQLQLMQQDPKGQLMYKSPKGIIIDEAQNFSELFSYIQVISDSHKKKGEFILSGSQNFTLNQYITQSLAGRAGILELLPLTYPEYLSSPAHEPLSVWEWLYGGGYPRPYQENIPVKVWMDNYVRTYLERDVRNLLNVRDLTLFQRFLRLCAGRHGQLLNISQLSIDCGISHTTVMHWISLLEASYLIFRLQPYHENFNKRLTKSPKLYFYDSGLVCYLLGIDSPEHLSLHVSRGAIFEGYVISELYRYFYNHNESPRIFFWRDSNGNEIDCLIEYKGKLAAIEIKSSMTLAPHLFKSLKKWQPLSGISETDCHLVYTGESYSKTVNGMNVFSWNEIEKILVS